MKGDTEGGGTQTPCTLVTGVGGRESLWGEDQKVAVTICLELMQEEGEKGVDAESHKLRGSTEVLGFPQVARLLSSGSRGLCSAWTQCKRKKDTIP